MKIETLLRAYTFCTIDRLTSFNALTSASPLDNIIKRGRQREAIRKGIIRKFERLERENVKLRLAYFDNVYVYSHLTVDDKLSSFIYLSTESDTKK